MPNIALSLTHFYVSRLAATDKENKLAVLEVIDGKLASVSGLSLPSSEDPFREVHENLYVLLAKCMRKKDKADSSDVNTHQKEKQLQTAWLYKQDLFVNPHRATSWAALGDHYAKRLEQLLDTTFPWQTCENPHLLIKVLSQRVSECPSN